MSRERAFAEALDAALDAVRSGAPVSAVIERYPEHASELQPLLRVAGSLHDRVPAPSARLGQNMRNVRFALHAERERRAAPWWRRPVTFASLSLPAGLFALVLVGGAAAAAGGAAVVATQTDLPAVVEKAATLGFGGGNSGNAPGHGGQLPGSPGGPAGAGNRNATPQPDTGRPTPIIASGTVQDVNGNVFTLVTADGEWHVNIDASTTVDGVIADGAGATVDGDATADKNLHAAHVTVTSAPAPVATATPHGNSGAVNTPPGQSNTPQSGRQATKTPEPTATPDAPTPRATPPGHGGGNGNGAVNGNAAGKATVTP